MTILPFGQIAPTSRRAVAYVIDALIAGGIGIVLSGILVTIAVATGSPEGLLVVLAIGVPVVVALELAWLVVYTFMQSGTGSIGMRAQGVRLVDAANGESIGFWRALLRNVVFGLAASIVVGYFTPLFDGSGRFQGWHDKVAKSVVIDARAAAPAAPPTQAMPVAQPFAQSLNRQQPPTPGAPVRPPLPNAPVAGSAPSASPFVPPAQPAAPAQPVPPTPGPANAPPAPANPTSDPLIAFVPGITQDAPPVRPEQPVPAVQPTPPAPEAPVAPAAPAAPIAPVAADIPPAPTAPVSAPAPVVTPSAPDDLDDEDIESTRISIPGHRLVFTWDDGTKVSVSRRTVFGRNPSDEDGAVVAPVRDETLSLSKTHFEAAAEAAGGWVRDLHSTNGLTIVRDGRRLSCPPGERVPIRLGDAIEIGDRIVTIGGYA